jgi:hypothetical protein
VEAEEEEETRRQRSLRRLGEGRRGGLGWAEKRKRDFIIFGRGESLGLGAMG